jgi:hypothetical protein
MTISNSVFFIMINVSDISLETHFEFSYFFFENRALFFIMWKTDGIATDGSMVQSMRTAAGYQRLQIHS